MTTKYKTCKYDFRIIPVEIVRETEQCVFLPTQKITGYGQDHRFSKGEIKALKVSWFERYHDSWEAAHQYLVNVAEVSIQDARIALQVAQSTLDTIKGMARPQSAA